MKEEDIINWIEIQPNIVGSNWCVYCLPNHRPAVFIYEGMSVCEEHCLAVSDEQCEESSAQSN